MISIDVAYLAYKNTKHERLSSLTWNLYRSRVEVFVRFLLHEAQILTVEELEKNREVISEYGRHLEDEMNLDVNSVRSHLIAVIHFCRSIDIHVFPVKMPQIRLDEPVLLSEEEELRLSRTLKTCTTKQSAIVVLMLECGLRPLELAQLKVANLTFSSPPGFIRITCKPNSRKLPISPSLRSVLDAFLLERCVGGSLSINSDDDLFTGQQGRRISLRGVDYLVRSAGERAGMRLSSRVLRNTYLARLAESGGGLKRISILGGLRSPNSCARYLVTPFEK